MDEKQPERIGIFGGTFDPIHYGHLLAAQSAAEEFCLDRVIFLPTGQSPHKPCHQVTNPILRCGMVQAAIRDNPSFALSSMEAENPGIHYTYRTLQEFGRIYPNARLYFIMGEDSMDDFALWKHPQEICRLAVILVAARHDGMSRLDAKIEAFSKEYGADAHMLHAPNFSVSSREIRSRIRAGKSVQYMIPKEAAAWILEHSLYAE